MPLRKHLITDVQIDCFPLFGVTILMFVLSCCKLLLCFVTRKKAIREGLAVNGVFDGKGGGETCGER